MKRVTTTMIILILLAMGAPAYSEEEPMTTNGGHGSAQEKATASKDDDLLSIYKKGWQSFLAPYLWVPGAHIDISHQGRFSGTTVADVPWYNLVPLLFSKVMGGMGRVEIWNGRWGLISDTNFIYLSDSVSASGGRELKLKPKRLPVTIPVRLQLSGNLKIWSRLLWQDVGIRYLLGTVPLNPERPLPVVSWELLGGLRYTYYNQDTSLGLAATLTGPFNRLQITRGGSFFDSLHLSFAEPFIGIRLGFWFTPKVNLLLKADCGGFGFVAYNNVDSVLEAMVGYQVHTNIRIYGGYRGRYASLSGSTNAVHGWFHGPLLGAVFNF